ncbi:TetR/AcrR family transcriptional regulator [Spirochaeta isovalerica]|uniref:TetR/AcrR family transcriptional repressor of nem operon n=1 Tax=Spirochaeta isovalerica TaxID=150 RepID=A0A841RGV0_9SPIO|nr:TetR/AcrR family transcriptional regulator [Spirochaeta isovalerica]MBB6481738.1 TetR/AcrR family transcriptional repressor of nem operon [Spirochaeta isovalerica]
MKNNNTKEHILNRGLAVVREKGFKNTGISEILKSASVPKGSFYYYFESKSDFGIELLDYAARSFFKEIESHFSGKIPPLKRIETFFDDQIDQLRDSPCHCDCLFGKLSQEMTDEDPRFREELKNIFDSWLKYFSEALLEAEKNGEITLRYSADSLARFILSGWEGALLQSKLLQSVQPLVEFRMIFLSMIREK